MHGRTPEDEVAALVDAVRRQAERSHELVELLDERHPVYSGRSSNAVVRLRGWVLAAFEEVGLPPAALPYVLDELQNGREPYLVAAAAMALRGLEHPSPEAVPFLLDALANVAYVDDAVSFESFRPRWPAATSTTATEEVLRAVAWLGGHARPAATALAALAADGGALPDGARSVLAEVLARLQEPPPCCRSDEPAPTFVELGVKRSAAGGEAGTSDPPRGVRLEDEHGRALSFDGFFRGKPSVVTFFYTRCPNPNKCSLTVTKMAALQRAARERGLQDRLRIAAVTYDPAFDLAPRLLAYGQDRGVVFSDDARFLRATAGFHRLQDYFALGVNYGPAVVNRHRIELFVLDRHARIAHTFARLRWDPAEVLRKAATLIAAPGASSTGPAEGHHRLGA